MLIKIASPGVPDFYQGTELWDLNLVDPDNRRSVDFVKRQKFLEQTKSLKTADIHELLDNFEDGRIKIFEISKALELRNKNKELFQDGDYIPLRVKGAYSSNVIAFCRRKGASWVVVVAPRFLVYVAENGQVPLGEVWTDTFVCLPSGSPKAWKETFAGESLFSKNNGEDVGFFVAESLRSFPVALLQSGESSN
jgi:(1->4)-alpha-D-glucan 1-alpha-D-glucosylmutase